MARNEKTSKESRVKHRGQWKDPKSTKEEKSVAGSALAHAPDKNKKK